MAGRLSTFGEKLLNQRFSGLNVLPGAELGALNAALLRGNAQFVILEAEYKFVACLYAECLAKGRRNHNTAVFVHASAGFFHSNLIQNDIIVIQCHINYFLPQAKQIVIGASVTLASPGDFNSGSHPH
jgi:hypothetical protein